jgi:hypothetical protein
MNFSLIFGMHAAFYAPLKRCTQQGKLIIAPSDIYIQSSYQSAIQGGTHRAKQRQQMTVLCREDD